MVEKTNFSGVYFVSGEREEGNKAIIKNANNQILWESTGQKTGTFNLSVIQSGAFSLCVESTVNMQLTVSFDFYDEKKDEQLISVQSIENLNSAIHGIRRKLDIIHGNIRSSAVRRSTHLEISNSINSKITFYTAVKIIFLIIFSVFWVLLNFKNVPQKCFSELKKVERHKPFEFRKFCGVL